MTTWKSRIPQTVARTRKELSALVEAAGRSVQAKARVLAPVDTGFLQNSIQMMKTGDLSAVVFVGAEYGVFVEFGTRRMRAQPFLKPALDEATARFGGEVKGILR
jgi:HK97 gp10 family phage protein